MTGYLLLEDGTVFEGKLHGKCETVMGEMNFYTHMAGYENLFTDAANIDKIMVMTYPVIGNYGFMAEDYKNYSYKPKAIVVKEFSEFPSHYQCEKTIFDFMDEVETTGLSHIDTRQVAGIIRDQGSMKVMITGEEITDRHRLLLKGYQSENKSIRKSVNNTWEKIAGEGKGRVALIDMGSKDSLLKQIIKIAGEIEIFPYNTEADIILKNNPPLVIISHGGDDMEGIKIVARTVEKLLGKTKIYGIGMGSTALALALGCEIYKMPNGHRGANYPVLDMSDGKVMITEQNISYAIVQEAMPSEVEITYLNVNDECVEGFKGEGCEGIMFLPAYDLTENKHNKILEKWIKGGMSHA